MMHSWVRSASAAVRQMRASESSRVMLAGDRPAGRQQRARGSGSAPAAGGRAGHCAPPPRPVPASRVTSSTSSSVKERPSRFSTSTRQPTTPRSRKRSGTARVSTSPHSSIASRSAGSSSGSSDPGHDAPAALDDRDVPGALVEAHAGAEPRLVLRRRLPRPDGRAGERAARRVVLVEVALPHVERLGDAPRDHRRRVVAGERSRDLGAGLDGEAHAVAAAHRRHDVVLGTSGRGRAGR